jgi:hypothetical protein
VATCLLGMIRPIGKASTGQNRQIRHCFRVTVKSQWRDCESVVSTARSNEGVRRDSHIRADVVSLVKRLPKFQTNLLPPSSGEESWTIHTLKMTTAYSDEASVAEYLASKTAWICSNSDGNRKEWEGVREVTNTQQCVTNPHPTHNGYTDDTTRTEQ